MKKGIARLLLTVALTAVTTWSYSQIKEDKVKPEKPDVSDTHENHLAQGDTLADYEVYRSAMEKKIGENDKKITDLKMKKKEGAQEVIDKYNRKVTELEKKNKDLKKRITECKKTMNNSKWQSFKRGFDHDMKELSRALKDLGTNNVK